MYSTLYFNLFTLFLSVPAVYESRVFLLWLRGVTGQYIARILITVAVCEM